MNNIRFLREKARMSQAALAAELGVSQQAIARWENGTADPRWDMAPKISSIFHCSIDALFGRSPPDGEGEVKTR